MSVEFPPFAPTREQLRTAAQVALDAAVAALDTTKLSVHAALEAKKTAQATIDSAKPAIMRAEANVSIAKANLLDFGPLPTVARSADDPSILDLVTKALHGEASQMTIDEILVAIGHVTTRENLGAYLSRWSKTGVILKGDKGRRLEPARFYVPPVANWAVPSFLAPPDVVTPGEAITAPSDMDVLGEDFPGVEALTEAGITTRTELAGATKESLVAIPGIGAKTADKILAALAG